MTRHVAIEPLTAAAFAPFGDVLEARGAPDKLINEGLCGRYHDRAALDFSDGRAGLSIFAAERRALPYTLSLIERHPDGSQAFVPLSDEPFLVIVAPSPEATPRAFLTNGAQAINFHRGTWHGVLTPLAGNGLFAVVDRIGDGANLEEHRYADRWIIDAPATESGPK